MNYFSSIKDNLNCFVNKYYTNQLIKGIILFLCLGTLFFVITLGVEYFLWLNSTGRFLLLTFILISELFLLIRYIIIPLFYLFKFKKGIDNKKASIIIGNHFPEVSDKLLNLLDLSEGSDESELLIASINQRSKSLSTFNFSNAINFNDAFIKAKYLIIPIVFIFALWFSGSISSFFRSYNRVVNYQLAFEQPAPFSFELLTNDLNVIKNNNITISVGVLGDIIPEQVFIEFDGQQFLMNKTNNIFEYTVNAITDDFNFNFIANNYTSSSYSINVIQTPSLISYSMVIDYPNYTKKKSDIIYGSGNATILEGSKVTWKLNTLHTNRVQLLSNDSINNFREVSNIFQFSDHIYSNYEYKITTSNDNIDYFENLDYSLDVIKDDFPKIEVEQAIDTLTPDQVYYSGFISDDYGINALNIVCYEYNKPLIKQKLSLLDNSKVISNFYYTFPSGLDLETDKKYSYYFEVIDNDAIHSGKISKSKIFNSFILNKNEIENKDLQNQHNILSNLDKSVKSLKENNTSLKNLSLYQKEKKSLSFSDKNKVSNFLKQQELQEQQMQKFSNQLKENLKKTENNNDNLNKLLQERLQRQELQAIKNKKLLEELNKIANKINKDELSKKLDNLLKNQKNSQRNLEQLLELTKRYYVTEAMSQLSKDLKKLTNKQLELAKNDVLNEFTNSIQDSLNRSFDELNNKYKDLLKDNIELNKPLKFNNYTEEYNKIDLLQNSALEQLTKELKEKNDNNKKSDDSKSKQKSTGDKLNELSKKLEESISEGSSSSVTEDAEVLRQILDNLIVFTFKQENLINRLNTNDESFDNQFNIIINQQELKSLFQHIDDSLFTLSLRVPEISEKINSQVIDIYYNIDKTIYNLSESNLYQGVSYQKYTLTSGNTLSDLLADILDNMEQSMKSGKGSGQGQDFQLPDIIKGQSQVSKKMKQSGQGKSNSKGLSGKSGKNGSSGEKGDSNVSGKNENTNTNSLNSSKINGGEAKEPSLNSSSGSGSGNVKSGLTEKELQEIYEIYKTQEQLKNKLENQLNDIMNSSDHNLAKKIIQQMNDFQDNLLENGITRTTIDKATIIEYELLKLEGASLKQGEKIERERNLNQINFKNPLLSVPNLFQNKNIETEILNRQALPLQPNYQNKIKIYFNNND